MPSYRQIDDFRCFHHLGETGGLVASGFAYIANTIFFANELPVQTWTNGGYPESLDLDRNLRVFSFGRRSGKPDLGCCETPWGTPGMILLVK